MADVTLHDGREITFDLYTFNITEYKSMFEDESGAKSNALIEKSAGLKDGELATLPFPDERKINAVFFEKCRNVTKDPNLESAST